MPTSTVLYRLFKPGQWPLSGHIKILKILDSRSRPLHQQPASPILVDGRAEWSRWKGIGEAFT